MQEAELLWRKLSCKAGEVTDYFTLFVRGEDITREVKDLASLVKSEEVGRKGVE